jgi:hypothetical protein
MLCEFTQEEGEFLQEGGEFTQEEGESPGFLWRSFPTSPISSGLYSYSIGGYFPRRIFMTNAGRL